jgi:hypothetical protein
VKAPENPTGRTAQFTALDDRHCHQNIMMTRDHDHDYHHPTPLTSAAPLGPLPVPLLPALFPRLLSQRRRAGKTLPPLPRHGKTPAGWQETRVPLTQALVRRCGGLHIEERTPLQHPEEVLPAPTDKGLATAMTCRHVALEAQKRVAKS